MESFQLIDYHMHSAVTVDGRMSESQACERAFLLGIREIAFTNHVMLTEPKYAVSPDSFAEHWRRVQICQEHYPEMTIRLGLEMDYYEGLEAEIAATIALYEAVIGRPLDLVLGSVHHLNGVFFSNKSNAPELFQNHPIGSLYRDYFTLATKAVRSKLFDVMAHPDLIRKFEGELSPRLPFETYQEAVEPYLDALLACDVGLEVNTKGYKRKAAESYPSEEMLRLYLFRAGALGKVPRITLGSDAHKAEDVGGFLQEGAAMLVKLGQDSVMSFTEHKPTTFSIRKYICISAKNDVCLFK